MKFHWILFSQVSNCKVFLFMQNDVKRLSDMEEENKASFGRKLGEMEQFLKLKVTGTMDADTLEVMKKPHCGIPDVAGNKARNNKWSTNELTYRYQSSVQAPCQPNELI